MQLFVVNQHENGITTKVKLYPESFPEIKDWFDVHMFESRKLSDLKPE